MKAVRYILLLIICACGLPMAGGCSVGGGAPHLHLPGWVGWAGDKPNSPKTEIAVTDGNGSTP